MSFKPDILSLKAVEIVLERNLLWKSRQDASTSTAGTAKEKQPPEWGSSTRAAGCGYKVLIYQFMKNNSTSERNILENVPNITFVDGLEGEKFSFQMSEDEKKNGKTSTKISLKCSQR